MTKLNAKMAEQETEAALRHKKTKREEEMQTLFEEEIFKKILAFSKSGKSYCYVDVRADVESDMISVIRKLGFGVCKNPRISTTCTTSLRITWGLERRKQIMLSFLSLILFLIAFIGFMIKLVS